MSRDKQIEEMARDLCERCDNGICFFDKKPCDLKCEEYTNARYLYEKGYRKASEVAGKIIGEILFYMDTHKQFDGADFGMFLAELEKKYTEGT